MRMYDGFLCGTEVRLAERDGLWSCSRSLGSSRPLASDKSSASEAVLDAIARVASDGYPAMGAAVDALASLVESIDAEGSSFYALDVARRLLSRVESAYPFSLPVLQRNLLRQLKVSNEQCALFRRMFIEETAASEYLFVEAFPGSLPTDVEYPKLLDGGTVTYLRAEPQAKQHYTEHRYIREIPQKSAPGKNRGYWIQGGLVDDLVSPPPIYGWREAAEAAVDAAIGNGATSLVLHGIVSDDIYHYARIKGLDLEMTREPYSSFG